MALRDFNALTHSPKHVEANQAEAVVAHERNGTLEQRDWWRISENAVANDFQIVNGSDTLEFIINADLDTRHVAILCAPEAHLDPYEISQIVRAAPVDGSTILAAYLYAVTDILEQHYSKACHIQNYHPFIKSDQPDWKSELDRSCMMYIDQDYADYMTLLATIWQQSEQHFLFDAGRKQLLYAALEADLDVHGAKPDWFLPSKSFLPFKGKEPNTNLIVYDFEVLRIPDVGFDWRLEAPSRPKSWISKLLMRSQ